MFAQLGDARLRFLLEHPQHLNPLGQGIIALALQLRVALHLLDRHARRAQFVEELDPANIVQCVAAVRVLRAVNRVDESDALVVAQGVGAQPGSFGNLLDGELVKLGIHLSLTPSLTAESYFTRRGQERLPFDPLASA